FLYLFPGVIRKLDGPEPVAAAVELIDHLGGGLNLKVINIIFPVPALVIIRDLRPPFFAGLKNRFWDRLDNGFGSRDRVAVLINLLFSKGDRFTVEIRIRK